MNPYLKLFFTAPLWASAFIAGQIVVQHLPPIFSAFLRFFIASLAMMFFLWQRHQAPLGKPVALLPSTRQDWGWVFLLAFFGVFLYNIVFMVGLQYVPGTRAATIIPTNPVFLVLIAWLVYHEPLGWIRAGGIFMAFFGALLVVTKGDIAHVFTAFSWHDLWLLSAIVCWIIYVMISKPFLKRHGSLEMNTWAFVLGTLMLGVVAPFFGDLSLIPSALMRMDVWLALLIMGFGASALAFIWYFEGMQTVGVIRAAVFISLIPVMAMFEAFIVIGQTILPTDWLGAIFVGAGIYMVNRPSQK